jgi:hypothetical protein
LVSWRGKIGRDKGVMRHSTTSWRCGKGVDVIVRPLLGKSACSVELISPARMVGIAGRLLVLVSVEVTTQLHLHGLAPTHMFSLLRRG